VNYGLSIVEEPAEEPLSLEEAKRHLRVDHTDEDPDIMRAIRSARRAAEKETGLRFVEQTFKLTLPHWPCGQPWPGWENAVALPVEPVALVEEVRYYDFAGTLTTMPDDGYQTFLDHSPPLIAPAPQSWWPTLQPGRMAPIEVEFVAGTAATVVPDELVQMMKLLVAYWYEHRGDSTDPTARGMPAGAERLANLLASRGYR
jgi:uncharacterized phiE125 gp8 family phage protein